MWRALSLAAPGVVAWGTILYLRFAWLPQFDGMPAVAGAGALILLLVTPLALACVLGCIMAAAFCSRMSHRVLVAAFNASFPIWLTILLGPAVWLWPFSGMRGRDRAPPPPEPGIEAPYDAK